MPGGRPFTRREALAAGWTDDAMRHAVRTGRWARLRSGVFVLVDAHTIDAHACGGVPCDLHSTHRQQVLTAAQASALRCPRVAISHASAAIAHGFPTVGTECRACVTVPAGAALRELAGVHLHRATLTPGEVVEVDGFRVTSVARTVIDVARELGVESGVVAADAALHQGLLNADDLGRAAAACAQWPGRSAAVSAIACGDAAAESPLESLSRLRMAEHAMPPPRPQTNLGDGYGRFIARVDFYWPEFGVAGQADGALKYQAGAAVLAEKGQQELLERLGVIVVRWQWRDLYRFDTVAARLTAAFDRGLRRGAGQRWSVLPDDLAPRFGANAAR